MTTYRFRELTDEQVSNWHNIPPAARKAAILEEMGMSEPDKKKWQSFVWHAGKCFLVSTIERTYDTYQGSMRGQETLAWEYDYDKLKRGEQIYHGGSIIDHQAACRCLLACGKIDEDVLERFAIKESEAKQ